MEELVLFAAGDVEFLTVLEGEGEPFLGGLAASEGWGVAAVAGVGELEERDVFEGDAFVELRFVDGGGGGEALGEIAVEFLSDLLDESGFVEY